MGASKDRVVLRVVLVLALIGSGCVRGHAPAATDGAWLAGTWQGEMWETSSANVQGYRRLTVTFAADGSWTATTSDGQSGSGAATIRDGYVVLSGWLGPDSLVHYRLKQRDHRQMWGMVPTSFRGRTASAMLDLERVN